MMWLFLTFSYPERTDFAENEASATRWCSYTDDLEH